MEPKEMIYHRRSVRSYTGVPVEEEILRQIRALIPTLTPLYPEIRTAAEIVTRDRVRCVFPWTTPQLIAVYSEEHPAALENAGFLFQQLELHLQCMGLGVCWLGMSRMADAAERRKDGLSSVILLAFGHPKGKALRDSLSGFRRKPLSAISDREDSRLEPARFAPSSINSQPWHFTHDGETIHVFCEKHGLLHMKFTGELNRMDIGIALAHLYVSNPDTFRFFRDPNAKTESDAVYVGSITL